MELTVWRPVQNHEAFPASLPNSIDALSSRIMVKTQMEWNRTVSHDRSEQL